MHGGEPGGSSTRSVTVKIDRTPPEVASQFEPVARDLQVFGRDPGSGMSASGVSPAALRDTSWSDDDDADDDHTWSLADRRAQLRTYTLRDIAGNSTTLTIKVRVGRDALKARDQTLQYNTGAVLNLPRAVSRFGLES